MKKKKKKKENTGDIIIFTHVYRKPQSGTVPEIQSDTIFLSFRAIFCPLPPPPLLSNTPENQNFEKKKKSSGDVIIL